MLQKQKGMKRILSAFANSKKGLSFLFKHEAAFRQEFLIFCILTPISFYIAETFTEIMLLIGSMVLVLIVEILNTAIETAIDRIGTDFHELSGLAKDLGSAAVLLAISLSCGAWLFQIYRLCLD